MNTDLYSSYIQIMKEELLPALGCTEPIAIAFAAAKAREVLGTFPEKAIVECSGNLIKNVKSVVVPNTDGLTGIRASMLAGLVGGNADNQLEVLAQITPDNIAEIKKMLDSDLGEVRLLKTDITLHLVLSVMAGDERVTVEIKHAHTNICRIERNGFIIFDNDHDDGKYLGCFTDRSLLTVKDIYDFANSVDLADVHDLIDTQIQYNLAIAEEGLRQNYGVSIGKVLLENGHNSVQSKMRAYAAAASEARMGGCILPVVTNSGSGNQGIATSVPVIMYAREHGMSKEKLYRGLVMANLLTVHQKTLIGRLSAFCGAVSAACSSGAAITYLAGGSLEKINMTIHNMLADVSGIVCDGAKPSCAAKIASCVDAAYLAHVLAMAGRRYTAGNGILKTDIEDTIVAVGRIASRGMKTTDTEILNIMLEPC